LALSGGWATQVSGPFTSWPQVYASARKGTGSWIIAVDHAGATLVNAYAECLANASGATITERALVVNTGDYYGGSGYASPAASCKAGEIAVGGGFNIIVNGRNNFFNGEELINTEPSGSSSWQANYYGPQGLPVAAYVECLTYSSAHSSFNHSADQGGLASITAACPSGSTASGGGFELSSQAAAPAPVMVFTMDATSTGWQIFSNVPQTSAYAACVTFS
jgi:hypothetical protein